VADTIETGVPSAVPKSRPLPPRQQRAREQRHRQARADRDEEQRAGGTQGVHPVAHAVGRQRAAEGDDEEGRADEQREGQQAQPRVEPGHAASGGRRS
jgi:hypothetical protein